MYIGATTNQGQTRIGLLARAAVRNMADQAEAAKARPAFRGKAKPGASAKNARNRAAAAAASA